MARGTCTFRQRDVTAALRAVVAAGVEVSRVEIDREGRIVIVTSRTEERSPERNEWDAA